MYLLDLLTVNSELLSGIGYCSSFRDTIMVPMHNNTIPVGKRNGTDRFKMYAIILQPQTGIFCIGWVLEYTACSIAQIFCPLVVLVVCLGMLHSMLCVAAIL